MKPIFATLGLLVGLVALGPADAAAQTRVGIALTFGTPHVAGHVVIGRPHYHRYSRPSYYRYRPRPVIIIAPRVYRPARVVVVRAHHPRRYHPRRHHRH
ncbi:MAG: hypothetical protein ACREME_07270 [Gemmatimonadales bacterium]